MIFTTQVVKSVTRSNIPEIPLKIHPKQWENGAYLVHICFLVCTHSVGLAVFWTEEDTNSSANHVTKGELECLPSVLWANVCGLWEMCYQELVNIVLTEAHTKESREWLNQRTPYVTGFAQSNHIPHTPRAPEKSDDNSQISHLLLCSLLPLPVKNGGEREGGRVGNILWMFTWKPQHMFSQRTWTEARDDMVVKGSILSHTWVRY